MKSLPGLRRCRPAHILLLFIGTLLLAFEPSASNAQNRLFEATLLGANEVPSVQSGASGSVVATLTGNQLKVVGSFSGLGSDYTASHIHAGATGQNGSPIFNLAPRLSDDHRSGFFNQTVTLTEPQMTALGSGSYYINVHSADHGGGEIRGQLFDGETRTFISAPVGEGVSPAFGRVVVTLNGTEARVLGFFVSLSGNYASASLHPSPEEAGPVVQLNANPDQNRRAGTFLSQRNIIGLSDALVEDLIAERIWVRIYSTAQTHSEARGRLQSTSPGFEVFEAALSGFNMVPEVNSAAVGRVTVVLGPPVFGLYHLHLIGSFDYLEGAFDEAFLYAGTIGETGVPVRQIEEIPGIWVDNRDGQVLRMIDYQLPPPSAEAIREGRWHIVVSSSTRPDGELRGQILPLETRWLHAHMTGSSAVPPVNTAAFGTANAILNGSELRIVGAFEGLIGEFTSAQIHFGAEGETTPPFMTLQAELYEEDHNGVFVPSAANGVVLLDAQVDALDAGRMYLNVASTEHAGGEIRGHFKWGADVGVEDPSVIPNRLALLGNFPNPFNPSTNIVFDVPLAGDISVDVFDLMGRRVLTIAPGFMPAGSGHSVRIDAEGLSSGIYFYHVTLRNGSETQTASGRMALLK